MWAFIIAVVLVLLVVYGFMSYNGLVKKKNLVQEAWRQIDVELKRRHDLIPNLVETVKGYATHERTTLDEVMRARSAAMNGTQTPDQASQTEGALSAAVGRLLAVSEAYPDLKANSNFVALQQELSATEDRIASGRRYYNATVRDLNTAVDSVPTNFIANSMGIGKESYFEAEAAAQSVPTIDFGQGSGTVAGPGQGGQGYGAPTVSGATATGAVAGTPERDALPQQPATPAYDPTQAPQVPQQEAQGTEGTLKPPQV